MNKLLECLQLLLAKKQPVFSRCRCAFQTTECSDFYIFWLVTNKWGFTPNYGLFDLTEIIQSHEELDKTLIQLK
ncbi:hypothetical protein GMES_1467 [Paraglaciecola mesophila KMM 241]|uniref:Uncharacterized protein n=1 Tax=Paraglaciecola mesophila KMM 241 TaxID=1128912 RepID=K6Z434_9ALTE|nr:hypothetical protein GMES_1467 [Paraglaciecola mesophila KMM 241]